MQQIEEEKTLYVRWGEKEQIPAMPSPLFIRGKKAQCDAISCERRRG